MKAVFPQSLFAILAIGSFDPTGLKCALHQKKFISEISFSVNDNRALEGELDNYIMKPDRDFISGIVFFNIGLKDGLIFGHTGDVRGVVSNFSLSRMTSNNNGRWDFLRTDPTGEKTQGIFSCIYTVPKK